MTPQPPDLDSSPKLHEDDLAPARGCLLAAVLGTIFWATVAWFLITQ